MWDRIDQGSSSISGVVVIEGANDPKVLAKLSQVNIVAYTSLGDPSRQSSVRTVPVAVNADGSFRISGLQAGKAIIEIESPERGFRIARIEHNRAPDRVGIEIDAGEKVTGVRVVLLYGALTLRGKLKIVGGSLPEGFGYHPEARRTDQNARYFQRTSIDRHGQFAIGNLAPGEYEIGVIVATLGSATQLSPEIRQRLSSVKEKVVVVSASSAKGYVPRPIPVNEKQDGGYHRVGDNVTITMIRGGVITGRVTNAAGEPLIDVLVNAAMARDADGNPARSDDIRPRFTNDRGYYRIYGLSPGTYIVYASNAFLTRPTPYDGKAPTYHPSSTLDTAAEVTVTSGGETSGVDIRFRGDHGHAVSGSVSGSGESSSSYARQIIALTSAVNGAVQSDAHFIHIDKGDAKFAIYGVADGEYEITARWVLDSEEVVLASTPRRVVVKGADVGGIEFQASEGLRLAARVRIHLIPAEARAADEVLRYAEVFARGNGSFSLNNIAPGKYWLIARAAPDDETNDRPAAPVAWDANERAKLRKEAEAMKIELDLKPCQRVADQVVKQ